MKRRAWIVSMAFAGCAQALAQTPAATTATADPWETLRAGGNVVLVRHAQTVPGTGDPPGFRLDDCSTQRSLSDAGRAQARRLGATFKARAVRVDEVRSSAWCRCKETADLAFGRHAVWDPLSSGFAERTDADRRAREVAAYALTVQPPRNVVLVTHQTNITAATGEYPAMGEVFIARPVNGALKVVARIAP